MNKTVLWAAAGLEAEAKELADKLHIEIVDTKEQDNMVLCLDENGLSLLKDGLTIRGDFTAMKKRLNMANLQHEMLIKAAKLNPIDSLRYE